MKYYLKHLQDWIIEFDDEEKKFYAYIRGNVEDFEAEEVDNLQLQEGFKTNGKVYKKRGKYGVHNPMSEEVKKQIWNRYQNGERQVDLSEEYGVNHGTISKIIRHYTRQNIKVEEQEVDEEPKPNSLDKLVSDIEERDEGIKPGPVSEDQVYEYQCYKGHFFESTLLPSESPKCTECQGKMFRRVT